MAYQILIADDEQIERMILDKKLRKYFGESCEISHAENGVAAVAAFRRQDIQIVIMDIGMPGMNGVEAAEEIRRTDENAVIIFLTAYDEFSYARRAVSIHALEYLLKPCEDEELFPVIEEAMHQVDLMMADGDGRKNASGADKGEESSWENDPEISAGNGPGEVAGAIREYIRNNYSKEISMQDAARAMNYSDVYFCKLFKQCFDQNFTSYLTQLRMQEAKKLLKNRSVNIKDVSSCVGYSDSNYFSKVFKRMNGMLPSEYRDGTFHDKENRIK